MDELAMTAGLIPVRHAALPGVIKLPRRYEKAALGDARTARYRRVSLCSNLVVGEGVGARLDDLMTAIMWVKQELILLRQHDILLKRQFFDIHHSITSLKNRRSHGSSSSQPSTPSPSSILAPPSGTRGPAHNGCSPAPSSTASMFSLDHSRSATPDSGNEVFHTPLSSPIITSRNRASSGRLPSSNSETFLDILVVRPSVSVTVLNQRCGGGPGMEEDEDTDGDDTFDEDFFRPRTSSMKTSRDLAALARRRGSKELI